MTKLFIGMPVYNGEQYIREALDSILNQSFKDWKILISDNNSSDSTQVICQTYIGKDNRIKYYRQKENIGAVENFKFVLAQANTEYFMWAAHDDFWEKDFIQACISKLEADRTYGFAFTNMVNIDSYGRVIKKYPSFKKYSSDNQTDNIIRYVIEPEHFGKANLFYSIIRTDILNSTVKHLSIKWGSDITLVLSLLARNRIYIHDEVLFEKRYPRSTDTIGNLDFIETDENDYGYTYPLYQFDAFIKDQLNAVEDTPFYNITRDVFLLRKELLMARLKCSELEESIKALKMENEHFKTNFLKLINYNIINLLRPIKRRLVARIY